MNERNIHRPYKFKRLLPILISGFLIFAVGYGLGSERIQLSDTGGVNSTLPEDLDYAEVESLYDTLKSNYDGQLTAEQLIEGLKEGLVGASGDTYTEYLTVEEAKALDEELSGSFTGIGAELGKDPETDALLIVAPIAGFPADKAGLKAKDVIAEIDGQPAYDLSVTEAVEKIRGPKNTQVTLKVVRSGKEELTVTITRDEIKLASVESEILEGNIGYLKISQFSEDTTKLAKEAAKKFKSANVKGVILDVRNNPGGLLDSAVEVSGLWLDRQTVLEQRRGDTVIRSYKTGRDAPLKGVPTVVLINEGSASASEIVAGALQDHGSATLMGEKSFGKGSVQQIQPLRNGGALKVTIARWYTPDGRNIDKDGIVPDERVELDTKKIISGDDTQLQAALKKLRR